MPELLKIKGLCAGVEGKELLRGIDLTVGTGETHVIMGPNGAGKSTLGHCIAGSPEYSVTGGSIVLDGEDITSLTPDKRAAKGIFLSFQDPVEIPGITLGDFLRTALEQRTGQRIKLMDFRKRLAAAMEVLQIDKSYADRELNVGFSGGEKKKSEILQLLILRPKLAILDETDSGLDVDAVKTVSRGVAEFRKDPENADSSLIVITHSTAILEALGADRTHILVGGRIVFEGGAELVDDVNKNGFEKYTGNLE